MTGSKAQRIGKIVLSSDIPQGPHRHCEQNRLCLIRLTGRAAEIAAEILVHLARPDRGAPAGAEILAFEKARFGTFLSETGSKDKLPKQSSHP